jgi:radical SAM superfamily enzyme YgiQ (UPF0313 family)
MRVLFLTVHESDNIGVRSLAAYLREHGHIIHVLQFETDVAKRERADISVDIAGKDVHYVYLNGQAWNNTPSSRQATVKEQALLAGAIAGLRPALIGFSAVTLSKEIVVSLIPTLRRGAPKAFIVGGGVGPTLEPEFFLRQGADAVIRGEGEESLLELADALENGREWRNIANISHLAGGMVCSNPLRPLNFNLDALPLPLLRPDEISCILAERYHTSSLFTVQKDSKNIFSYNIITSKGCLNKCSYCNSETIRGLYTDKESRAAKIRRRSLDMVIEECCEAKKRGYRQIFFRDEFFIRPKKEFIAFLEEYRQKIHLPFRVNLHPLQLLDDHLLMALRNAGLHRATFGIQSADENFCAKVYHRNNFRMNYAALLKKLADYGIAATVQFIEGNPLAGKKELRSSLRFLSEFAFDPSEKVKFNLVVFFLYYLPRSPLVEEYPHIVSAPRTLREWFYNASMLALRTITEDKVFSSIYNDPYYKKNPEKLSTLYAIVKKDAYYQYIMKECERLSKRPVYFWGCGELYRLKKHLFYKALPQKILIDVHYDGPGEIDGIPVCHPSEITPEETLPVVVFSSAYQQIYRTIRCLYPHFDDVTICRMA